MASKCTHASAAPSHETLAWFLAHALSSPRQFFCFWPSLPAFSSDDPVHEMSTAKQAEVHQCLDESSAAQNCGLELVFIEDFEYNIVRILEMHEM